LAAVKNRKFSSNEVKSNDMLRQFLMNEKFESVKYMIEEIGYSADVAVSHFSKHYGTACATGTKKQKVERCKTTKPFKVESSTELKTGFVEYLISKNAEITNVVLENVTKTNELTCMKLLVEHYNDEVPINWDNHLKQAARRGHIDIVKYLIEEKGVDINEKSSFDVAKSAVAYPEMIAYFLDHGLDVSDSKVGANLLMWACGSGGCVDTAKLLLDAGKIDLKYKTHHGYDVVQYTKVYNKNSKANMKVMLKLLKQYMK